MTIEQILEKIKQERGESALWDGKQLIGLFVDFAKGQLKPQANVLRVFLDCQGNTRILNLRGVPQQKRQLEYHHLVLDMVSNHCMQESAALEVCGAFWQVVNGTPPPVFSSWSEPDKVSVPPQPVSEPPEPALDAEQMYQQGQACYQSGDYPEAAKWYRKAAEQGHIQAQLELGFAYENGNGVKQNSIEAVNWYRKAAEQGYAAAQDRLAYCYGKGCGVEQNLEKAVAWCRKAYKQDFPGSGRRLRQLEEKMSEERPELYPQLSSDEFGILNGKLVKYNGSAADVVIPAGIKQIKTRAFANNQNIRSVTIPEGVTGIEMAVFSGCNMLRQVVIPGSVSVLNMGCFTGCSRLEKVVLHSGVQKIIFGNELAQLHALKIVIPDTVTSVTWSNMSDVDRKIRMKHPKKIIASEKWAEIFQGFLTDNPDFSVQSQLGMGGWFAAAVQRIKKNG